MPLLPPIIVFLLRLILSSYLGAQSQLIQERQSKLHRCSHLHRCCEHWQLRPASHRRTIPLLSCFDDDDCSAATPYALVPRYHEN
ncbi:hypothetical protein EV1_031520 [Malus domestica]